MRPTWRQVRRIPESATRMFWSSGQDPRKGSTWCRQWQVRPDQQISPPSRTFIMLKMGILFCLFCRTSLLSYYASSDLWLHGPLHCCQEAWTSSYSSWASNRIMCQPSLLILRVRGFHGFDTLVQRRLSHSPRCRVTIEAVNGHIISSTFANQRIFKKAFSSLYLPTLPIYKILFSHSQLVWDFLWLFYILHYNYFRYHPRLVFASSL